MTDQIPANLTREEARAVREWAERARGAQVQDETVLHAARVLLAVLPTPPTTAKETPEMTDQTLDDQVRPILDEWERIKEHADWVDMDNLIQNIRTLLPARPTLADMTDKDRAECQWMQCDVTGFQGQWVLATTCDDDDDAGLIAACGEICWSSPAQVTPRPDLPRLTWPGDQKPAPAPALPGGWRLADHKVYGRVIVTTTEPDQDGDIFFVYKPNRGHGSDNRWCKPAALTFLDQDADQ